MLKHYLIAALRSMEANKLLSTISILGLAIGFMGAILMALVIRNDLSYDHFLPGYERTYVLLSPNLSPELGKFGTASDPRMADLLRLNVPEIENVTRLDNGTLPLKQGKIAAREHIYWADPNIFSVLPFPVLYGDAASALSRPDGIVLTRATAEKYFGRDDVVGQIIAVEDHTMTVRAVIEDLPLNGTNFENEAGMALAYRSADTSAMAAFISNRAPFAPKSDSIAKGTISFGAPIYLRLKRGASVVNVNKAVQRLYSRLVRNFGNDAHILRIDRIHLLDDLNPGIAAKLAVSATIGLLILFIAVANYVNLAVARAVRRQREVGVRKASGAGRGDLMRQFLGEALVSVTLAACIAVALMEWLLPAANSFLQTNAIFDYGRDPAIALCLVLGVLTVGMAAGAYPALILSSFRPASVLKGWVAGAGRSGSIRNVLVTAQFAILVILIIAASVVYQQRNYAARAALRANIDQMLIVQSRGACAPAFRDEVMKLSGVMGAACTNDNILDSLFINSSLHRGRLVTLYPVNADRSVFALYGISPVAGSLRTSRSDGKATAPALVINQGAVKELGFASPQAALGQTIWQDKPWTGLRIVAVVPDFTFHSVELPMAATVFSDLDSSDPTKSLDLHIRLRGQQIPETLAAIDRLWSQTGGQGAIRRFFLDAHLQELYAGILRQAQLFGVFAGVAVFLACLGLVGIAISTAERRTKEIGIRKAAGATSLDIIAMLLWQFSKPVLWANVIAWPLAWWLMQRWLSGFTYHVDLHAWLFPAAGAMTLLIALLTVSSQAWLVARQKPVLALRYE